MKRLLALSIAAFSLAGCSTVDVHYPDGTEVRSMNAGDTITVTRDGPKGLETITIRKDGSTDAGKD